MYIYESCLYILAGVATFVSPETLMFLRRRTKGDLASVDVEIPVTNRACYQPSW